MTKRMLINATQQEEVRVALVEGQWLYNLDIESTGKEQKKGNLYQGIIKRIEPSLEAAFVDYGAERHGFLPLREIARSYFSNPNISSRFQIKDVLKVGQSLIVQVDKEERGTKGAVLTTFISLAGCYLVLMPNNPKASGISRRIDGEERQELKEAITELNLPEGMGSIVRTAGLGRHVEDLQWDLSVLLTQWESILKAQTFRKGPFLIYQESNILIRAVRDHLRQDIQEILVDEKETYQKVLEHIKMVRPDFIPRVKQYEDTIPLFSRFQIETQIQSAFQQEVYLPSGGAIVIDQTEALISIDINSARATSGKDIEQTALQTNLEAATEIARQLRLRDLGGLIVIDFIDMTRLSNRRMVEKTIGNALSMDRARVQIGQVSQQFGLLQMSRQRLRPHLGEATRITCPRCAGAGNIPGIEPLALVILRVIEEESLKDNTAAIQVELPVKVATYLINEKRTSIVSIETRHDVNIILLPNPMLQTPHYSVERIKSDASTLLDSSYKIPRKSLTQNLYTASQNETVQPERSQEKPAVELSTPSIPAPTRRTCSSSSTGFVKRLLGGIFGSDKTNKKKLAPVVVVQPSHTKIVSSKPKRHQQRQISSPNRLNIRNTSDQKRKSSQQNRSRLQRSEQSQERKTTQNRQSTRKPQKSYESTSHQKTQQTAKTQSKEQQPDLMVSIPMPEFTTNTTQQKPQQKEIKKSLQAKEMQPQSIQSPVVVEQNMTDEERYRKNLEISRETQKKTPFETKDTTPEKKSTNLEEEKEKARYLANLEKNRKQEQNG